MTSPAQAQTSAPKSDQAVDDHDFLYKAFISYSHRDDRPAQRLHRQLERYRIPKSLRREKATLGPIFRDKVELSASSGLEKSITTALRASENLVVLCSPNAVASRWVDEEITYFKSLGREDRIFTVILSGEPNAVASGFDEARECLPKTIRYDLTADGNIGAEREEPLAADFRENGDGEKLGTYKLLSGLLECRLDALLQRQLVRVRRRMIGMFAGASLIVAVLSGLTWTAYTAQQQAEARRADAENFVEFLLGDLAMELESIGRLDILDLVGEKANNYYQQFEEYEFDAKASGRRARTLHLLGELQNSLAETTKSQDYFDQAYAITKIGLARDSNNSERVFEHARSAYLRSLPLRRIGNLQEEIVLLQEYEELSGKLRLLDGDANRALTELAQAKTNLGRVKLRMKQIGPAKVDLMAAENLFKSSIEQNSGVQNLLDLTENLAWLAEAYRAEKDYQKNYDIRAQQVSILNKKLRETPDDFRLVEGLVYAKLGLGNAAIFLERTDDARSQLDQALNLTQNALRLEPNREKMRRAKSAILLALMNVAGRENDAQYYQEMRDALTLMRADPIPASVKTNRYWDEILPQAMVNMDAKYKRRLSAAP